MEPPDYSVKGYFSDGKMEGRLAVLPRIAQSERECKDLSMYHLSPDRHCFSKICAVLFHVFILFTHTNS